MLPDLGCYEERYRLTGSAALGLAASLLAISLGLLWHTPVIAGVIAVLLAVLAALGGGVFSAARRALAFRVDHTGITLGAVPGRLPPRRGPAVFVPWADVEQIVLYPVYPRARRIWPAPVHRHPAPGGSATPAPGQRASPRLPSAGRSGRRDPQDYRLAPGPRAAGRRDRSGGTGSRWPDLAGGLFVPNEGYCAT